MQQCLGCFGRMDDEARQCPVCGYAKDTPARESYHLEPGSVLQGKYIVGRVLGYGGFGITYVGWDAQLERKVAVKEYLPGDFASRMPGDTKLTVYGGEAGEQFSSGLESFVEEARRLARFNSQPGIVDIYDSFLDNNTGYIVMQYLEGQTVKELLSQSGPIPFERARRIVLDVLQPLKAVHKEGIIHRDIAPDNIFIQADGETKLIDFGASRYASTLHSKSLSVILKPGYAPEEQYRSRGNQGPWSDIYALAATFYKMLTGVTPEEAMERKVRDTVAEPSKLGAALPGSAENAIMNAMNVNIEDRTQSAEDFEAALLADGVERHRVRQRREDSGRLPLWLKIAGPAVGAVLAALILLMATGVIDLSDGIKGVFMGTGVPEGMTNAPGMLNRTLEEAQVIAEEAGLVFRIIDKQYSDKAKKDRVLTQDPKAGRLVELGRTIGVVVSAGPEIAIEKGVMPDVTFRTLADAQAMLARAEIAYELQYEASETVQAGNVIRQSVADGTRVEDGATVILTVSTGGQGATITTPSPHTPGTTTRPPNTSNPPSNASDFEYKTVDGRIFLTKYKGTSGASITLPTEIDGKPVLEIAYDVFAENSPKRIHIKANIAIRNEPSFANVLISNTLEHIEIENVGTGMYASRDGVLFSSDMSILYYYPAAKPGNTYTVPNGTTSIDTKALMNAKNLQTVNFSTSVESINEGAFNGSGLTSLTIPGNVKYVGIAFADCANLKTVTLQNGIRTLAGGLFRGCGQIQSLTIPASVEILHGHAPQLSYGCPSLKEIRVDSGHPNAVSIDGVVYTKDMTQLLEYPRGKTGSSYTIPESVGFIHLFTENPYLTTLVLPDNCVPWIYGESSAIREVKVSDSHHYLVSKDGVLYSDDGEHLWYYPPARTETAYTIQEGVTRMEYGVFNDCKSLTSITVPKSLQTLQQSFVNCAKVKAIYFEGNYPQIDSNAFIDMPKDLVIYYKRGTSGWPATIEGHRTQAY